MTELEAQLLSNNSEQKIKEIKNILLTAEQNLKRQQFSGCSPNEFAQLKKELEAIYSAYHILDSI